VERSWPEEKVSRRSTPRWVTWQDRIAAPREQAPREQKDGGGVYTDSDAGVQNGNSGVEPDAAHRLKLHAARNIQ
jgi:hypothetical protein